MCLPSPINQPVRGSGSETRFSGKNLVSPLPDSHKACPHPTLAPAGVLHQSTSYQPTSLPAYQSTNPLPAPQTNDSLQTIVFLALPIVTSAKKAPILYWKTVRPQRSTQERQTELERSQHNENRALVCVDVDLGYGTSGSLAHRSQRQPVPNARIRSPPARIRDICPLGPHGRPRPRHPWPHPRIHTHSPR